MHLQNVPTVERRINAHIIHYHVDVPLPNGAWGGRGHELELGARPAERKVRGGIYRWLARRFAAVASGPTYASPRL